MIDHTLRQLIGILIEEAKLVERCGPGGPAEDRLKLAESRLATYAGKVAGKPAAWMNPESGDVWSDKQKRFAMKNGEAASFLAARYYVPLYGSSEVTVEAKWIPVGERLPKVETPVLIQLNGKPRVGAIFVQNPSHEDPFGACSYWDDPYDDGQDWEWDAVECWMPLPGVFTGKE